MTAWKRWFFASAIVLLASNLFWLLKTIDAGVAYSYQQASLEEQEKTISMLGKLVVWGGRASSQKEMLHILRTLNPDALIVEEPESISVDGIRFVFVAGRLSEVGG